MIAYSFLSNRDSDEAGCRYQADVVNIATIQSYVMSFLVLLFFSAAIAR